MKMILHVNVKPTKEDEHMTKLFFRSGEMGNQKNTLKRYPIAKYDGRKKKGYLEYPDGSKIYDF
ncbi:hypothetical protein ACWG0P_03935 [Amedibacillus sp. YH-ame6]